VKLANKLPALAVAVALAVALGSLACTSQRQQQVSLAGTWPSQPDDYEQVTRRWTRHDRVRGDISEHLSEIVSVHATLLSPEWRAAYVAKRSEDEMLSPAKRQALLAAQRERDAAYYEVMLIMSAYERRLLDFDRGERSVWRVVLTDGRGNEIEASSIERDRRLRSVIAEYFPALGDFERPFLARFPRDIELFGGGAETIELILASPRATVKLVWDHDA
jgi:hypothetical protein